MVRSYFSFIILSILHKITKAQAGFCVSIVSLYPQGVSWSQGRVSGPRESLMVILTLYIVSNWKVINKSQMCI